jgi:hypothetical protein
MGILRNSFYVLPTNYAPPKQILSAQIDWRVLLIYNVQLAHLSLGQGQAFIVLVVQSVSVTCFQVRDRVRIAAIPTQSDLS